MRIETASHGPTRRRPERARQARLAVARQAAVALALLDAIGVAHGADVEATAQRPALSMNRWQEDWGALANPAARTQPLDGLKYISLSADDPASYLSLGGVLRERFEWLDADSFGTQGTKGDSYVLQRAQVHADLHVNSHVRAFVQLEDDQAYAKADRSPVDQDRLDLRLAMLEYTTKGSLGTFKSRVGRQDFAFDLQRFISSRDGPNVRQSFDAVWADWETTDFRTQGFVSRPLKYKDDHAFDDHSNAQQRFSVMRFDAHVFEHGDISAYYALLQNASARFLDASGSEHRNAFDVRFVGMSQGWNWDAEAMWQTGHVGGKAIQAWAVGPRVGYQFSDVAWKPHLELQADVASGDKHAGDSEESTFNPLFPSGYYFTQGGFTGFANLVHLKSSLVLQPAASLMLLSGFGMQWRQTTHDAVYVQPNIPIQGTAGQGGSKSGNYAQLRAECSVNRNIKLASEADRFFASRSLAEVGARDSSFMSFEFKVMW